jgi:hypothetical protein
VRGVVYVDMAGRGLMQGVRSSAICVSMVGQGITARNGGQ